MPRRVDLDGRRAAHRQDEGSAQLRWQPEPGVVAKALLAGTHPVEELLGAARCVTAVDPATWEGVPAIPSDGDGCPPTSTC